MSVSGPHDYARTEGADVALVVTEESAVSARTPWQLFWLHFKRDRVAVGALIVIVVLIMIALFAPIIVNVVGSPGPNVQQPDALNSFGLPSGPSSSHFFGVDEVGRDVFTRVVYGARVSLEVAFIATGISVILGTTVGMIAGFFRGWIDSILARTMDILLAFPVLLLALGLGSACSLGGGCLGGTIQAGLPLVIAIIAFAGWPYVARIMRGQVLTIREKDFVDASRSLGASNTRIIFREILPNLVAPIVVYTTLIIPTNILFEAALSFLGIGIQPPQASWGSMIALATSIFQNAWWYMLFPGLALVTTVLAFNLVGDGLQDALNPRGQR